MMNWGLTIRWQGDQLIKALEERLETLTQPQVNVQQ